MKFSVDGPGIGLPLKFKYKAWILVLLTIVFGCVISLTQNNWEWLARFGAMVVVLAMIIASFNTYIESKYATDLLNDIFDPSEEIYESIKAKPHLYGISRPISEEETRELIAKERARRKAVFRSALQRELSDDLKRMELRMASIGTLLWGFADLLNCAWQC